MIFYIIQALVLCTIYIFLKTLKLYGIYYFITSFHLTVYHEYSLLLLNPPLKH